MFKYRIYPRHAAEQNLDTVLRLCQELYNAGLSERKDAYQQYQRITVIEGSERTVAATMTVGRQIRSMSFYGQKRDLVDIKELRPEYRDLPSHVLQDVLNRLDKAFAAFFRRLRDGETPGYPRFKGRTRYNSFTYPDGAGWKLTVEARGKKLKGMLFLSKIGEATVRLHRPLEGRIKTVTIKLEVDQWYVVFSCEVDKPEPPPLSYEDVGIDLGISHLATLSTGEMIEHPRYYRAAEQQLKRRQQAVSRKKKGSRRRKKAGSLVGKAHRKIARQRRDFSHKEARKLVSRFQMIVFEDLQTKNLVRRPKPKPGEQLGEYLPNGAAAKSGLNKSILDASWGLFVSLCTSKAEEAGRTLIKVDPKFTTQTCSQCGRRKKKDLSERWHECECGADLDRDVNAAKEVLTRGKRVLARMGPTSATA